MTRKMEHIFLHAPNHFSFEEAIRYSQVLGLGGNKELANAVVATYMGRHLENDDFWRSVIYFFINAKDLKSDHVNPIVDFLYHIKFSREEVNSDDGVVMIEPSRPNFSMKGRTFSSIMRLVENWHKELSIGNNGKGFTWRKSRFNDFRYLEESYDSKNKHRIWRITELLSSMDLLAEGRMMNHCVSSYTSSCFHGKSSIWSLKRQVNGINKRVITIEVDPSTYAIRQVRGRFNSAPNKKAIGIMKKWANREGLKFGLNM